MERKPLTPGPTEVSSLDEQPWHQAKKKRESFKPQSRALQLLWLLRGADSKDPTNQLPMFWNPLRALQHQSVAVNTKHGEPPAPAAFTFKPWQAPASQHIPVEFQPSAASCSSPAEPALQMSVKGRQEHHAGNLCSCSQQQTGNVFNK